MSDAGVPKVAIVSAFRIIKGHISVGPHRGVLLYYHFGRDRLTWKIAFIGLLAIAPSAIFANESSCSTSERSTKLMRPSNPLSTVEVAYISLDTRAIAS